MIPVVFQTTHRPQQTARATGGVFYMKIRIILLALLVAGITECKWLKGPPNDLYKCELETDSKFSLKNKNADFKFKCTALKHNLEIRNLRAAVTGSKREKAGTKTYRRTKNFLDEAIAPGKTISIKKGETYEYSGSLRFWKSSFDSGMTTRLIITGNIQYPGVEMETENYSNAWKTKLSLSKSVN
jgi:hypothetical protein